MLDVPVRISPIPRGRRRNYSNNSTDVGLNSCMFTRLDMVGCTAFVHQAVDSFNNDNICKLYDSQSSDFVYEYRSYTYTLFCLKGKLININNY